VPDGLSVRSAIQYRSWQFVTAVVGRIPPRASYAVAAGVGTVTYYCWPRARRSMHRNFRRVLGPVPASEVRAVARRSLVNYCCYLADFVRFPSLDRDALRASVHGDETFQGLDRALEAGRGAVIVCMHLGNWDLAAGATAARGYPVTVVAETFADPRLDALLVGARARLGMRVVKMERAGPSLIRSLKQNGLLALLIDRPLPGEGVRVQFFGEDVEVPAGPARIALRAGAVVIPAAFPRSSRGSLDIDIHSDFAISTDAGPEERHSVQTLTQAIMTSHERFIRQYPDQWYMFREMWPRKPRGRAGGT
jgi:phosphatidylinositol dimannoside acyltransferase